MTLAGIHFLDGSSGSDAGAGDYGGALYIDYSALVSVQGCKLSSNQAGYGGGIYAVNSGTTLNVFTTTFDGNTATNNGDDIYVTNSASVTVHSTCPPDWSGTPATGSNLDTYTAEGGTISGTTKSFDIG